MGSFFFFLLLFSFFLFPSSFFLLLFSFFFFPFFLFSFFPFFLFSFFFFIFFLPVRISITIIITKKIITSRMFVMSNFQRLIDGGQKFFRKIWDKIDQA